MKSTLMTALEISVRITPLALMILELIAVSVLLVTPEIYVRKRLSFVRKNGILVKTMASVKKWMTITCVIARMGGRDRTVPSMMTIVW